MADEHQFIQKGLKNSQINEYLESTLQRAGYGGMEIAKTPMGTQIVLKAEKPGMVIGKSGKKIREITAALKANFDLDDPQIDVQEINEPDLNAQIVADRLANALERGWYFRKAGHTTVDRIMSSGALGAEIVLSGKVTGARGRVEKFNRGYIKHNGEPAAEIVDRGQSVAILKLGTIGVNVKIIPPGAQLPDDFRILDTIPGEEEPTESDSGPETEAIDDLLAPTPESTEPTDDSDPAPAVEEIIVEKEAQSPPKEETNLKLTDLPGVGPSKAQALEEAGFDTIEALQAAGVTDLAAVPGISENLAEKIKTSLDKGDN
ncbi:MAG: 30S ribosomal protein S3 [Halobacteriales archaeon]